MRSAFYFDLDGTITTTEILPCIASELGITEEIDTLTRLTMDGHVPFIDSMRLRCIILAQVPLETVHAIVASIPLERVITDFIAARRDECFVVTGNLDVWVSPLIERLGCGFYSSTGIVGDGRVSLARVLDKGDAIREVKKTGRFDRHVVVGDGANDVAMLSLADIAIAYGSVHAPAAKTVAASHLIINTPESLCNLLKAL